MVLKFNNGQNLIEYTIVISIVLLIVLAMTPMLKRALQGLVTTVADQVGLQNESDQKFDESGHLEQSYTSTRANLSEETRDRVGVVNYVFQDLTSTSTRSMVNLGYTNTKQ